MADEVPSTGTHASASLTANMLHAADSERTPRLVDLAALFSLGLVVALSCRGHFVKPHGDFFEIQETGSALLSGELPDSFKRAPLYPLLVAMGGRLLAALVPLEVPAQTAAEWINALLLPLNAVLLYLVGRSWLGSAAGWVSALFLFLPWGIYCTAHLIVEPLVVGTILLSMLMVQRGAWRVAYIAAAAASLARYDAAGALVGVALADRLGGQRWGTVATRSLFASAPLAAWLALTAWTWQTRAEDHYLVQIAERPTFAPLWLPSAALRCVLDVQALRFWGFPQAVDVVIRHVLPAGLIGLALLGTAILLRRRDRAFLSGLITFVGYWFAHSMFPFHFERFGYPMAPLVLLALAVSLQAATKRVAQRTGIPGLRAALLTVVAIVVAAAALGEAGALPLAPRHGLGWTASLTLLAAVFLAARWAATGAADNAPTRVLSWIALIVFVHASVRQAQPLLGTGREMANLVEAARWVAAHTRPEQRVLSASPGMLRLYAGRKPAGRFLGFGEVAGTTWPEILAECRQRSIDYIIWYDQLIEEAGAYYAETWRLDRFAALAEPEKVEGVRLERRFADSPDLWILRVDGEP